MKRNILVCYYAELYVHIYNSYFYSRACLLLVINEVLALFFFLLFVQEVQGYLFLSCIRTCRTRKKLTIRLRILKIDASYYQAIITLSLPELITWFFHTTFFNHDRITKTNLGLFDRTRFNRKKSFIRLHSPKIFQYKNMTYITLVCWNLFFCCFSLSG